MTVSIGALKMLGIIDAGTFNDLFESLEFKVELPPWLDTELEQRGLIDARHCDLRRTPRFRCCGQGVISVAQLHPDDMVVYEQAIVVIRDISRTGIGLLTHQEWRPDQSVEISTVTAHIQARTVRTSCLGPKCYSTGVLITGITEYSCQEE